MRRYKHKRYLYGYLFILLCLSTNTYSQSCDPSTPTFTFDLTGNPDSVWVSPSTVRSGLCCGLDPAAKPPIRCVEFFFTLDSEAEGIRFDIASGAIPPGALGYQIGCGPVHQVGENICLSGPGPHRLTFCKPGNNPNTYSITSIAKPKVSPPSVVSDACSGTLTATGYDVSTIQWSSVPFNATHNSYLSCSASCDTTTVTYQAGAPAFIDYQISGYPIGGCSPTPIINTTRVYFVNDKAATIEPQDPIVCFGGTNTTITANGIGGAPPYNYLWNTGETTQTISVGIGTYWVEISDSTSCPKAYDTVTVTAFLSPITANAGPDVTSCVNNPAVVINASVNEAAGGIWSGGAGTYSPDNTSLNLTYTPSPAEITSGQATLLLTTTGNRNCPPSNDEMAITIVPSPIVNAGIDRVVCANNSTITLNGSVVNAVGGTWTGGTGTFSPDANSLNATYSPSADDITAGSVTLTLTSIGNGTCNPVTDQMTITITAAPTVNAGPDQPICFNNAIATLNGSVTIASGGIWSGGSGTFSPNATTLNATYTPSAAEKSATNVTLILTSTGNGNCLPVADQVQISITPAPIANAGPDQSICANNATALLSGSVSTATNGTWTGGTGVYSPDANSLNASYTPSANEITNGSVTLTLTTTGNGTCLPVTDRVIITITPAPRANAGPDRTVCANNPSLAMAGSVSIASGGTWSGGTGTFSPDANTLNATYTPSPDDITAGTVSLTLTTTGNGTCNPVSDLMVITITTAPTVNAGPDQPICFNNAAAILSGSITVSTGGIWSGGSGTFAPNATSLNATYIPSAAEKTASNVTLTLTTTGNGNCLPVSDEVIINITPAPIANAGPDQSICANNATAVLSGSVSTALGGTWSGGTGVYSPDANTLGATYAPSASEITNGSLTLILTTTGNGTCLPVTDRVIIAITPAPTVSAGSDQSVCSSTTTVDLNGTVTISTGGEWSTLESGTFSPNANTLGAIYTPSAIEIANGSVILTLTTTGNGTCLPVQDNMTITFSDIPTANAGPDQTACTNNFPVLLNATGSPGVWSGGTGTFNPTTSSLNATYTPSADEVTAETVTLTYTTTLNGACNPVSDEVIITIPPGPTANAGSNMTVCADISEIELNGSVLIATGGIWSSSGTGTFSPKADTTITKYIPSAADTSAGSVTLTLTSTGNGSCNPSATDQILVTITPAPTINAGMDQTICADAAGVNVNGSSTIATGVVWSTLGTGTFSPRSDTLNATYIPSEEDTAAHTVTLALTSTIQGTCSPVSDNVVITITPEPIVNAGIDQTVCADSSSANLHGSVLNATGGLWSTTGTGVFSPNPYDLNALYFPSDGDRTAGSVNIILTSTGNGNCNAASGSSLILSITPAPTVHAGADQTVCADTAGVTLNGTLTVAIRARWTTSGSGTFFPNDSTLNASYIPSSTDITNGTIQLNLTSYGNENCINVSDQMILTITPAPSIDAGTDQIVCSNNTSLTLNGSVITATGGIWSGGTGTFTPDPENLNASYTPSPTEVTNGAAELILISTGNGDCKAVSDTMIVTITPAPEANAGVDQVLCMDQSNVSLSGAVVIASGGSWSSLGTGTFLPDPNSLNTTYIASSIDKSDTLVIILTTSGNGNCLAVRDTMQVSFTTVPTVDAGPASACSDDAGVQLNGSVTIATTGLWTTSGTGTFTPASDMLNPIYIPSSDDRTTGSVTLTLTATTCKSTSDNIVLNITPAPVSNAGMDQTVCANNSVTQLNGSVQHALGGRWTSSGSGAFSPDQNSLSAAYSPSAADIIRGYAAIILTTTGNGSCREAADTLLISITPAPTANAGPDQTVCADIAGISLNGAITVSGGGLWTSSGTGSFSPNANTLNGSYIPSSDDITIGRVTLSLTTTENNLCNPVTDQMIAIITPAPTVDAGPDQTACSDVDAVAFYGSVSTATGGRWTSSGTGSFSNSNQLHTIYTLTASDKSNGTVRLVLTSTGNGTCMPVTDTTFLSLTTLPGSNAGIDQTVCNNNTGLSLNGTVTGATGGIWSSSGTGSFSPDAGQLDAAYVPSPGDTTAGIITLTLATNVIGGCSVFDTMNVRFIDPLLNLPAHYCFEEGLLIDSDPSSAPASGSFQWYMNNTILPMENNSTLVVNDRGIYKVSYTFDQCTIYDSTNITLPEPLVSEDKLICEGGSTTINTSIIPQGVYEWRHQGIVTGGNSNSLSITDSGDSTYSVTVIDSLACIARDTVYVTTIPPPILTLTNLPSCVGNTITLTAVPSNIVDSTNSRYQWFKDGIQLSDTLSDLNVTSSGSYSVIYTLGECMANGSSTVTFHSLPVTNMADFVNYCQETDLSVILDAGPGFSYDWLVTGNNARQDTVLTPGVYPVRVFNEYNCFKLDSIKVRDICPPILYPPTVFSPNGDGKNDFYYFSGVHFKSFKLTIYNRWGEIIFYSEDRKKSWDGKYRNELMPIGVYAWTLTYEGEFEEYKGPYNIQGSVTLTR